MAEYRLLVADFQTRQVLEELPFEELGFDRVLNKAGSLSTTLPLRHPKVRPDVIRPMITSLYVVRDDQIVWSGIVVTMAPNTQSGNIGIGAMGLFGYADFRTLNMTKDYKQWDQTAIAADLINYMQSQYSVGWALDCPLTGVKRDRHTYYSYERFAISGLIQNLSSVINGFDFEVISSFSPTGGIVDTFRTYYPSKGQRRNLKWVRYPEGELGSNVDITSAPFDGTKLANVVHLQGAGEGYDMRLATAADPNLYGRGRFPMLERVFAYKDIKRQDTLNDRARSTLTVYKEDHIVVDLMLDPDHPDTSFGSFEIGDVITLEATDGWLALDGLWKIIEIGVQVDNQGREDLAVKVSKEATSA